MFDKLTGPNNSEPLSRTIELCRPLRTTPSNQWHHGILVRLHARY